MSFNPKKFIEKKCKEVHDELIKKLDEDPDNEQLSDEACAWEDFCEEQGFEGFEFS
jgi:hypothetical protein